MHLLNVSWNFLFPKQKSRNSYTFKIISFPHTLSPIVYDQIDNLCVNFKKQRLLREKELEEDTAHGRWCAVLRQHTGRLRNKGRAVPSEVLIPTERVREVETSQPNIRW